MASPGAYLHGSVTDQLTGSHMGVQLVFDDRNCCHNFPRPPVSDWHIGLRKEQFSELMNKAVGAVKRAMREGKAVKLGHEQAEYLAWSLELHLNWSSHERAGGHQKETMATSVRELRQVAYWYWKHAKKYVRQSFSLLCEATTTASPSEPVMHD